MTSKDDASRNRLMAWLMIAVASWGGMLSLGTLLFGINDEGVVTFAVQPVRGLVAILTVAGFIALWAVTDLWRKRRLRRRDARIAAAKLADKSSAGASSSSSSGATGQPSPSGQKSD